jgi:hypothetical protein
VWHTGPAGGKDGTRADGRCGLLRRCRRRDNWGCGPRDRQGRWRGSPVRLPGTRGACSSMRSRMCSVRFRGDPLGTWAYAHTVPVPSGARVGSKFVACTTRMNGRSGWTPRYDSVSARSMASRVPSRCTVPARRRLGSSQGMGPCVAASTLKTPGARTKPVARLRYAAERSSAAIRANWLGVTSSSVRSRGGSSASEVTSLPVSNTTPRLRAYAARAAVSVPLPPRATGQPARVGGGHQKPSERRRQWTGERKEGVGGAAREQCSGRLAPEAPSRHGGRHQGTKPEAGERDGMTGEAGDRSEDGVLQLCPVPHERLHHRSVGGPVRPELFHRGVEVARQKGCRSRGKGMGDRNVGLGPGQAVVGEGEGSEIRRQHRHRVRGGTHVMADAGNRELHRAGAAADLLGAFDDEHGAPGVGQGGGGGETIRPCPDDDGVIAFHHRHCGRLADGFRAHPGRTFDECRTVRETYLTIRCACEILHSVR